MSDKEYDEINEKIIDGLALAERRMLEEKAKQNETIVISENGHIREVYASDVLKLYDLSL